jgi:acyl-CoA synthetase (AMP-forming)/AMP-acid ligase II
MAVVLRDCAAADAQSIAIRDAHVALTWPQVNSLINRVVNGLNALDLGPSRRVAVFAENAVETVFAHLGTLHAGGSSVPVNFHLNPDEVAYILKDSDARLLFTGPENLARAVDAVAQLERRIPIVCWRIPGDAPSGVESFENFTTSASEDEPRSDVPPRPNLMYTSGTTGFPKGVELPPTMFAGGKNIEEHVAALKNNRLAALGVHLVVGPMYHTGPLSGVRVLAAGTPVVIMEKFDPERTLELIQAHKAASSVMVPTHFKRMLDLPDDVRAKYDVSSMKVLSHTGAKCPIDVKKRMIEWFGPVFVDAYGATEVGTVCSITSQEWLEHPGSVGRVVNPPFARCIVVDDDGNELPAGTEGRLFFEDSTGRGVVYPNDPEKSKNAHLRPGVFTLGEIGYVDPDGYVYITDRFSDMIVSGGVNIYPAEAEKVLIEHPGVADVAVIGVPDPDMGEAVKALVVPQDPTKPPTPEELIALCREHLAGYKCPRTVDIVSSVGRNAMGKINKRELRAPYWESGRTIGG